MNFLCISSLWRGRGVSWLWYTESHCYDFVVCVGLYSQCQKKLVIFRQEKSKFFVKWPSSISHSKTET